MRICLLSFHCCPFSLIGGEGVGGMNVYIRELCSALASFPDAEIDIFTRRQFHDIDKIKKISPFLRIIHLEAGPPHPIDRRNLYDHLPEFIDNLEEFIISDKQKYDLVYSHYWLSGLVGEWLKYRFGIPLVHSFHTLGFLKNRALESGEHIYRNKAERHLIKIADVIISSSQEEKNSLVKEFDVPSNKIRVIYPGVNKKMFHPALPPEPNLKPWKTKYMLLYVGRIEPIKGLVSIIDAIEILKTSAKDLYSELSLVVIGGGLKDKELERNHEFAHVQDLIQRKNLQGKVHFLGSMEQAELKEYYSAADALVVPSLYESFGLVVVEALACGTPVLVSKIGKMKSIVKDGHTGYSFRPDDPDSLSACLQYFFVHRESLWTQEKIRQDVIDRFSWSKTAEESFSVFKQLLDDHKRVTTTLQRDENPQLA